jgi:hypothetical protein
MFATDYPARWGLRCLPFANDGLDRQVPHFWNFGFEMAGLNRGLESFKIDRFYQMLAEGLSFSKAVFIRSTLAMLARVSGAISC